MGPFTDQFKPHVQNFLYFVNITNFTALKMKDVIVSLSLINTSTSYFIYFYLIAKINKRTGWNKKVLVGKILQN